jgi:hypothetical protein
MRKIRSDGKIVECGDAHLFPFGKKGHIIGNPADCPCEGILRYTEEDIDGNTLRRIIEHGRLTR